MDLTITQSEDDENKVGILQKVNERIAVNSFSNGLRNTELRTIIKARNYTKLSDAIQGAKDEEVLCKGIENQVYHTYRNKNLDAVLSIATGFHEGIIGLTISREISPGVTLTVIIEGEHL